MITILENSWQKITNEELEMIKNMAKEMDSQDREHYKNQLKADKCQTAYETWVNGFGGEFAFCKMANIPFNSTTENRIETYFTPDFTLPDKKTGDVKATKYKSGKLLLRKGSEKKIVDLFILMTGAQIINGETWYQFKGWATYQELVRPENLIELLPGCPSYALTQDKLHKILIL